MSQFAVFIAGLLLVAESQASDVADRSTLQGFLSKSDYDKFITPNLNRVKHGNELGASPFTVVDDKPVLQSSAQAQEKQAAQELLANNSYDPISLSVFGIGLVSFVTMLGLTLWRALQPATIPTNTVSASGGQVMEMKSQDSNVRVNSGRVGWGQQSSNNSRPQTLCYASVDSILEDIKGLTLVEASELVSKIEETFGVDASSAPVAMVAGGAAAGGGEDAGAAEEKDEFDVMLTEVPADKKIAILKIVRNITGLGLKEAKGMVESAPVAIKEGASKDEAADIQKQIEETGGKVELK